MSKEFIVLLSFILICSLIRCFTISLDFDKYYTLICSLITVILLIKSIKGFSFEFNPVNIKDYDSGSDIGTLVELEAEELINEEISELLKQKFNFNRDITTNLELVDERLIITDIILHGDSADTEIKDYIADYLGINRENIYCSG